MKSRNGDSDNLAGETPDHDTLPRKRQLKATSGLNPFLKEFESKTTVKVEASGVKEKPSGTATHKAFGVTHPFSWRRRHLPE